jgi:nucleoside-diphosphate-sugar epimerase
VPAKVVTITGGSGFVGRLLRPGLERLGYRVDVFDRYRGALVDVLRRRHLGTARKPAAVFAARALRLGQVLLEPRLAGRVIRPTGDDILDEREALVARFRGSYAVVHLAGIPHPNARGCTADDYRRLNYEGSVNVFEAAREAGVPRFVFASSAQVYRINDPVRLDQLPILESNYCPTPAEGQTPYGHEKREVERYLEANAGPGATQAISLRLEFPGIRSESAGNLYVSTSVENLVAGFACALEAADGLGHEAFNVADATVAPEIVDVQDYIRTHWPDVPNRSSGNECLLSTEKARRLLGYRPHEGGTYIHPSVAW